jgi:steroid delta-isomerase-like uncharacterized protein
MQENAKLVHRWFEEVWNQAREETINELFASDAVAYGLGETDVDVQGPAQFKTFFHNFRTTFPDIHITIEDTIADGDKVTVRLVLEGTHQGDGLGIPPTGRRVRVAGIVIAKITGGQIVAGWNSWDQLGLLRQLGALPAPDADRFLTAHA